MLYMNTGHIFSCCETKINPLKLWIPIQQYTVTDFQGWSKMTFKNKVAYFLIFRSGLQEILRQLYVEPRRQAEMIKWNRFNTL